MKKMTVLFAGIILAAGTATAGPAVDDLNEITGGSVSLKDSVQIVTVSVSSDKETADSEAVADTAGPDALNCSNNFLGKGAREYLNRVFNYRILFGFTDGTVYQMVFKSNVLGTMTAVYSRDNGEEVYRDMELYECVDRKGSLKYIEAFKDKISPAGTYKYNARVLIPVAPGLPAGEQLQSFADLRWGNWRPVVVSAR